MFVNRFVLRLFPTAKSKVTANSVCLVKHIAELSYWTTSSNSALFGIKTDGQLGCRILNNLPKPIFECSKKLAHTMKTIETDAQHFTLLKKSEKRMIREWDPKLHKLEMEKLGLNEVVEEDDYARELRLQTEKIQQNAVLTEIESQLSNPHVPLFAVVQITGRQYKISEGDILIIQGYWAPDVGDRLRFEKILLVGSSDFTLVGQPMIDWTKFRVEGTVIEKTLSELKLHFVMRRRNNYRRLNFNKFPYTMLRITKIEYDHQQLD